MSILSITRCSTGMRLPGPRQAFEQNRTFPMREGLT
jgi:hypothetical protein